VGQRPNRGGYNAFFRPGDARVGLQFAVAAPDGLLCRAPIPAPLVYPYAGAGVLTSPAVTLPVRDLQRDRRFTVHHSVTWTGSITFTPVGCTHYEFSPHAVRVLHDCV
jgi:hypothetical protein